MADQRLFFALWPDSEVCKRLARVLRQQGQAGRMHHPEDLHITLVFLGQVAEDRLACVYEAADGISSSPFSMALDSIGYWPRPRILWCGPSLAPEPLLLLVKDLQQALESCGFEPERRRYSPHITLFRKARRVESGALPDPISWPAREFVLATSGSGPPDGRRYRILKRWPLA